ncbi:MAG: hypothetical protein ACRDHM_05280, partial [Actinomycetota bacterium]
FSEAVTVDDTGNVYFPMFGRAKIMKIDTLGIITTFVGEDPESSVYGKSNGSYIEVYGDASYTPAGRDHSVTAVAGPIDVAVAPDGKSVYYVGGKEFAIRKVDPEGIVRQIAGNSLWRYCGDGGPAASSNPLYGPKLANNTQADGPRAVADAAGNVYIADVANNAVRKVSPDGTISTLAGRPKPCTTGGGYGSTFPLICPGGYSGDGGPPAQAELSFPMSLALDDHGLYILDRGNAAVRYINLSDQSVRVVGIDVAPGTIETVAGGSFPIVTSDSPPQARFRFGPVCNNGINYNFDGPLQEEQTALDAQICPNAIAIAPNGDLFVLDGSTHAALYRVDSQNRLIQVAGRSPDDGYSLTGGEPRSVEYNNCPKDGGVANRTPLCLSYDIAADDLGNVYVLQYNGSIVDVSSVGNFISYVNLGDQPVTAHGVTVAPGEIRRVAAEPTFPCRPSAGDEGPARDAVVCSVSGITIRDGNLFIVDNWNAMIRVVDPDGIIRSFAGGPGTAQNQFGTPQPFTGAYTGDGGLARDARFLLPGKPSIPESAGYLLVSDSGNYRVRMVVDCWDPSFSETPLCTAPLPAPTQTSEGEPEIAPGGGSPLRPTWHYEMSVGTAETSAWWGPDIDGL